MRRKSVFALRKNCQEDSEEKLRTLTNIKRIIGDMTCFRHVSRGDDFQILAASASTPPAAAQAKQQEGSDSGAELAHERRRSWARLIKKVYEADPLVCPHCSEPLKIISLIGDGPVIEKILRHLKLWDRPERPPPSLPPATFHYEFDPDAA